MSLNIHELAARIRQMEPGPMQTQALAAFERKYAGRIRGNYLTDPKLARSSLPEFIRQSWHLVEPTTNLSWNWHLDELCSVLEQCKQKQIKRLIINFPPGCMKSLCTSVFFPSYLWANDPSLRFLTASYSDVNTIRDNRRCRDIVSSDWFKLCSSEFSLSSDQAAKVRFDTTLKGWRIATSVGGMGTGEHPDFIIVDDPLKADDSRSETMITSVNEWFDRTLSTRVARDPVFIIIMQRLHMSDLTSHLLSKGGFEHICFPMRFMEAREKPEPAITPDPRDHRSVEGELLWPEQWPEDKVHQEEILLGQFGVSSQLQQQPVPEGGGLIKREWLKIVDAAPVNARRCRGWDTADTEGTYSAKGILLRKGDWTVGVRVSVDPAGNWYIEDVIREKARSSRVNDLILTTAILDGKSCLIREGAGSGKATIAARAISLAGYDYAAAPETESKISRANPFRAQCEAGNVYIVRGEWNEAYISVLTSFPVGKYDDDVDATSDAFNELAGNITEKKIIAVSWGRK